MGSLVQQAKALRKNMTEAEKQLWYVLQSKYFQGLKFRRQEPLGKYIVDFVCYSQKLIIELDGGQHAGIEKIRDTVRDRWLESEGFKVLRFWNNEVIENRDGVLQEIIENLAPSPSPSHRGRGRSGKVK